MKLSHPIIDSLFTSLLNKLSVIEVKYDRTKKHIQLGSIRFKDNGRIQYQGFRENLLKEYHKDIGVVKHKLYEEIDILISSNNDLESLQSDLENILNELDSCQLRSNSIDVIQIKEYSLNGFTGAFYIHLRELYSGIKKIIKEHIDQLVKTLTHKKQIVGRKIASGIWDVLRTIPDNPHAVRSFTWLNSESDKELRLLFDLCNGRLFVTDFPTFKKAFRNVDISDNPLKIKWILKQRKNKNEINKKAIFSFLYELNKLGKIEEKFSIDGGQKQSEINKPLYDSIFLIFTVPHKPKIDRSNLRNNFNNFKENRLCPEVREIIEKFKSQLEPSE